MKITEYQPLVDDVPRYDVEVEVSHVEHDGNINVQGQSLGDDYFTLYTDGKDGRMVQISFSKAELRKLVNGLLK